MNSADAMESLPTIKRSKKQRSLPPLKTDHCHIKPQRRFDKSYILPSEEKFKVANNLSSRHSDYDRSNKNFNYNDIIHNGITATNDTRKSSNYYIDSLIQQNKEASRQRISDFDKLVETLVKKREEEIFSRKNERSSLGQKVNPLVTDNLHARRSDNLEDRFMNTMKFSTRDDSEEEIAPESQTQTPARPKSARYGSRREAQTRPTTGYGNRKRNEEEF